jgi:hypothetical protein
VRHAEIDTTATCCDRSGAVAMIDIPGALPDYGYLRAVRTELMMFHRVIHL